MALKSHSIRPRKCIAGAAHAAGRRAAGEGGATEAAGHCQWGFYAGEAERGVGGIARLPLPEPLERNQFAQRGDALRERHHVQHDLRKGGPLSELNDDREH